MLDKFKERVMTNTTLFEKVDQLVHYYPVYVAIVIFVLYYGLFWLCFLACDNAQRAMFRYITSRAIPPITNPRVLETGHTNDVQINDEGAEPNA